MNNNPRKRGFYRVKTENEHGEPEWVIGQWINNTYRIPHWLLPGLEFQYSDSSLIEIDETPINPEPTN